MFMDERYVTVAWMLWSDDVQAALRLPAFTALMLPCTSMNASLFSSRQKLSICASIVNATITGCEKAGDVSNIIFLQNEIFYYG